MAGEESHYSWFLNMCGYKHAFWWNLILIIFFGTALLVVTISLYIWSFCRLRRIGLDNQCSLSKYGVWSLNFSLRFVYDFFLDICICVFINLVANGVDVEGVDLSWSISLILTRVKLNRFFFPLIVLLQKVL